MKRGIYLLLIALFTSGCGSFTYVSSENNYKKLTIGMYMHDVNLLIGPPERYLSIRRIPEGIEEVWQYRNPYNQLFALTFLNEYLVAANYIYGGGYYPMYQTRPPFGYPVFPPSYKPNKPTPVPPGNSRPPGNNNNNDRYPNPRPDQDDNYPNPRPGQSDDSTPNPRPGRDDNSTTNPRPRR